MSALDIPIIMPKGCSDPRVLAETGIAEIGSYWSEMQQTVVENSISIGKLLIKVKEDCQKAGIPFAAIFEGARHPDPGIRRLPFSQNTGNRFMHIARNPALLNCAHVQNLPDDRFALYELSRLEPDTLTKLIGEGTVQRDMDREQVVEVVKKHRVPFYRKGSPRNPATTAPKPAQQAPAEKVRPSTEASGDFAKADAAFAKNREGAAELARAWSSVCKDVDFPFSAPLAKLQNLAEQTAGMGIGGVEWLRQDLTQREFTLLDWFLEGRLAGGAA